MSDHILHCYEWLDVPAARVQRLLRTDAARIFRRATTNAADRETSLRVQLHMRVGAVQVATDVDVQVGAFEESMASPFGAQVGVIALSWTAAASPSLFPHMRANLYVYPLSSNETQLDFEGEYTPPLGLLGEAIDAIVGRWVAEACILQFMHDVAAQLESELSETAA